MYRSHQLLLAIASAGVLLLSAPAGAGQAFTSFQVTATVGEACTLSAPDLAFGTYAGTTVSGQTNIQISCSTGGIPGGTLSFASATNFVMTNPTDPNLGSLDYDLYLDAAHAQQILSGQSFPGPDPAEPPVVTIFGEIPGGQTVPDGNYSDTVSVVFNF